MEHIKLNNGVEIPKLGFGVFQISKEDCEQSVLDAIDIGYRLIDTAQYYFNEEEVGKAISKTKVPREELFITTKVGVGNYGYDETMASVKESMKKLQVDYLDLILLHQPFGDYYGSYRALEDLYKDKKVRAIGISNFYPDRLSDLCAFNEIVPQVNQVEVNVFHQQIKAQENMEKNNVQIEAWAPFGEGRNDMFQNKVLLELADKYKKSLAQIILRWLMQRDVVTLAKSVHKDRMKENLEIFDFKIDDEDMKKIAKLDTGKSLFYDHQTPEAVEMMANFVKERRNK